MINRMFHIFFITISILCFFTTVSFASPVIEIVPPSGAPGDVIKINGKGFKPEEEVDVLFILDADIKIAIGTEKVDVIKADAQGNFSVSSGIPVNAKPGTYTIEAFGNKDSTTTTKVEVTPKKK
ncbi:MAG: hypothetical protein N3A62_04740 [Thermodesulfovibrionales bacterium]|nr:hypothetical protein [Thermodesulfovibrionales bacterium]